MFFFSIMSESILGLEFCLVNENSLNCRSGLVLLRFFSDRVFLVVDQWFCVFE